MVNEIKELLLRPLLQVDMRAIIIASMETHQADMIEINKQQLQAGQTAEGIPIKPFYKPVTIKTKRAKGQPADKVTLHDKGGFYNGFYAKRAVGGNIEISSIDEKTERLERKYTVAIFGLSVPSREQLSQRMKPTIQTNYKRALGL